MSTMALKVARSSVFTFESTVHSQHVLLRLDEQRCSDTLCDVTVMVEGQGFRAHRSVLASCSEYFAQRISSLAQHGAVITLPPEVTVAGFEPLLKFAYTSKLLFGKDSVLEIHNSASILGFRDLDKDCFDFLLPKFFSSSECGVPFPGRTCCQKNHRRPQSEQTDSSEAKPAFQQDLEATSLHYTPANDPNGESGSPNSSRSIPPLAEGTSDGFVQCPKYRKFQLACGKDPCVDAVIKDECNLSRKSGTGLTFPVMVCSDRPAEARKTDVHDKEVQVKTEMDLGEEKVEDEVELTTGHNSLDTSVKMASLVESMASGGRSPGLILHHKAFTEAPGITRSPGHEGFATVLEDDKTPEGEEAAEKMADRSKDAASDVVSSQPKVKDSEAGSSSDGGSGQMNSTSLEWLKLRVNLSSGSSSSGHGCPFLQNLDQSKCLWEGSRLSESEAASHSPTVSSMNSGEDGESGTETEGDSESYARERARQVRLPFSVDLMVNLSRNDFQQLLKQETLTQEQLELVQDLRRRSKNRLAARRCRKRKLDCIHNLQSEINKLKSEREKLMLEKNELKQLKMKTCHSVSILCQRVCSESHVQPDQVQVLSRYSSSDCPLASLFPHIDALLSQRGFSTRNQTLDHNTEGQEALSSSRGVK